MIINTETLPMSIEDAMRTYRREFATVYFDAAGELVAEVHAIWGMSQDDVLACARSLREIAQAAITGVKDASPHR